MVKYNYNLQTNLLTILTSENCISSLHFYSIAVVPAAIKFS